MGATFMETTTCLGHLWPRPWADSRFLTMMYHHAALEYRAMPAEHGLRD